MGQVIPFRVDRLGLLREDILECLRSTSGEPRPDEDTFVAGANRMARWLLRSGGAVERLTQPGGAA